VTTLNQQALFAEMLTIVRKDRARRSRWRKLGSFLGALFGALALGFLNALSSGWAFMLAVGVVHAEWLPQVPTLGYWWSVLIAWLLRWALTHTPSSTKKEGSAA
jgi:hypothetical protein